MKEIEGFPGYFIEEDGTVWSESSGVRKKLKTRPDFDGYLKVNIRNNGKRCDFRVHRLVAQAFIPNPNNLPFVLHKDDNPSNPHKDNLFWGTNKDNVADMHSKGRHAKGEIIPTSKLISSQIIEIRNTPYYSSINRDLALKFGVTKSLIWMIRTRKIWKHLP